MMVVGFTAAPAAAVDDGVSIGDLDLDDLDLDDIDLDDIEDLEDVDLDDLDIDDIEDLEDVDLDDIDIETDGESEATSDGLEVEIVETNSPVNATETLEVTAEFTQHGDGGFEDVELEIDSEFGAAEVVDSDSVHTAEGTTTTMTFEWDTSMEDTGDHTAIVNSEDDSDSTDVSVSPGYEAPEELCTDVPEEVNEEVPFEDVPWFDDLPEEAPQPPGVPTDIITPEAVAAIVVGATPNQCDIQDPNDPSYDPVTGDDEVDPDYDVEVQRLGEFNDGAVAVVTYDVTLDESGEGPGVSGVIGSGVNPEFGDTDLRFAVADGEKEYAVDPHVRYWDDGTAYAETDVELLNSRLGVEVDCDGEECQPGTRGVPEFVEYPAFPAPTAQDDDGDDEDAEQFPEELCTDVPEEVNEEVPFEDVPWFDDLPEEAPQPPGVPTDIITPEAVAAIVVGATPNQCDIQDPNDPSYDPVTGDDEVDPDYDVEVQRLGEFNDGAVAVVTYDVTLNESGEGPGVSGVIGSGVNPEFGDTDLRFAVADGEKEYAVDPRVRYWDDGTAYAETDVELLNSRLGVEVDCDGEECQPGTRGVPEFVEYPAFPAPTGDD